MSTMKAFSCLALLGLATVASAMPTSASSLLNITNIAVGQSIPLPSDYISTVLYHHNIHRQDHSAGPLVYDESLACAADQDMEPTSCPASPGDPGNLAWFADGSPNYGVAAQMSASAIFEWYNEEPNYAAASNGYTTEPDMSTLDSWGHFSQMIWASDTAVGCWATFCGPGTAYLDNNYPGYQSTWLVGCKYAPGGNLLGDFQANVFPPLGQPVVDDSAWNNSPDGNPGC